MNATRTTTTPHNNKCTPERNTEKTMTNARLDVGFGKVAALATILLAGLTSGCSPDHLVVNVHLAVDGGTSVVAQPDLTPAPAVDAGTTPDLADAAKPAPSVDASTSPDLANQVTPPDASGTKVDASTPTADLLVVAQPDLVVAAPDLVVISTPDLATNADLAHQVTPVDASTPTADLVVVEQPDLTPAPLKCALGHADCNSDPSDGCEINLLTDASNCGVCGGHCGAGTLCNLGVCVVAPIDCGKLDVCKVNGTEFCADIATDPFNCGGCGNICSSNNIDQNRPSCTGKVCGGACSQNFADCNHNKLVDGCETNLLNDATNCGACGISCPANVSNGSCSCQWGVVTLQCNVGFAHCNWWGSASCEVNTDTDINNCGGCFFRCGVGQSCAAGRCVTPVTPDLGPAPSTDMGTTPTTDLGSPDGSSPSLDGGITSPDLVSNVDMLSGDLASAPDCGGVPCTIVCWDGQAFPNGNGTCGDFSDTASGSNCWSPKAGWGEHDKPSCQDIPVGGDCATKYPVRVSCCWGGPNWLADRLCIGNYAWVKP